MTFIGVLKEIANMKTHKISLKLSASDLYIFFRLNYTESLFDYFLTWFGIGMLFF